MKLAAAAVLAFALAGCGTSSLPAAGVTTSLECAPITYPAAHGAEAAFDGVPP